MSKHIIVADIKSNCKNGVSEGHYFAVAQNYLDILSDDYEVQIAGGPIYKAKFENIFLLPFNSNANESKLIGKIHTIINGLYLFKKVENCTIILQCNAVSTIIGLLAFIRPKAKIILIQYDRMIRNSVIRNFFYTISKKRISGIICPGEEIGESLELPYCIVPDYIFPGKVPDKKSELKYDFGIYGILSADKGVLEAAEYFAKSRYKIKIAGKISNLPQDQDMEVKLKKLADHSKNIDLTIGYLDEKEYREYIASTRFIVLNYSGVYMLRSSGVILDAIYSGKPVLAKKRKYVEFVEDNGLGILYKNLEELDLDRIMADDEYAKLTSNILNYLEKQTKEISKLKDFIEA